MPDLDGANCPGAGALTTHDLSWLAQQHLLAGYLSRLQPGQRYNVPTSRMRATIETIYEIFTRL
jgi:hypothetical protein